MIDISPDELDVTMHADGRVSFAWRGHAVSTLEPVRAFRPGEVEQGAWVDLAALRQAGANLMREEIAAMSNHERIAFYAKTRVRLDEEATQL